MVVQRLTYTYGSRRQWAPISTAASITQNSPTIVPGPMMASGSTRAVAATTADGSMGMKSYYEASRFAVTGDARPDGRAQWGRIPSCPAMPLGQTVLSVGQTLLHLGNQVRVCRNPVLQLDVRRKGVLVLLEQLACRPIFNRPGPPESGSAG